MKGSCLCGAVAFIAEGEPKGVSACHCTQCRKQSGHVRASAHVPDTMLKIEGEAQWHRASETVRRDFCPVCGSFPFWKQDDEDHTSFALGGVDGPTGVQLARHIFTDTKGDYYEIKDGLPLL